MGRQTGWKWILLLVLVLVLVLVWEVGGSTRDLPRQVREENVLKHGGGRRKALHSKSPNVVVDTLNLAYHVHPAGRAGSGQRIGLCEIIETIDATAPTIREHFRGKVYYVVKDRDSVFNDTRSRDLYQAAAERNRVTVVLTERYMDTQSSWRETGEVRHTHQKLGRDDFYIGLLAWKLRCGVLTGDMMRDFNKLKTEVRPFLVYEYDWAKPGSAKMNQVNPGAAEYRRIRAPVRLRYADYGIEHI